MTKTGMKSYWMFLSLAAIAPHVVAQSAGGPNPADPSAPAPAAKYESAFEGYIPYRDQKIAPWREVNEEVTRAGGHKGMFGGRHGEGGKPASSSPATGQPAVQAPPRGAQPSPAGGHAGH